MKTKTALLKKPAPFKNPHNNLTLAPIADFENHMNPEWWKYIFNAMYIKTDGDVVEDDEITRYEVDMFSEIINADKDACFLDVCCGQGRYSLADGDFLKNNFKPRTWEWINKNQFVCRERCLSSSGKKLISREMITQTNKRVIADQFYAENLYNKVDLQNLTALPGFENIAIASPLENEVKETRIWE